MRWHRGALWTAVAALVGCGRLGFDPTSGDGGPGGSEATDATGDATSVSTCSAWGPPALVAELSSAAVEFAPALDPSGRVMVFEVDQGATVLAVATRASSQGPFGQATVISLEGGTAVNEPAWSRDGQALYYKAVGLGLPAVREVTHGGNGVFGTARDAPDPPGNNVSYSADGLEAFTSDTPPGGDHDLRHCSAPRSGHRGPSCSTWAPPGASGSWTAGPRSTTRARRSTSSTRRRRSGARSR